MLYREIVAVCSQIHTKHINTLCGQNVELYIKTQSVPRSKHSVSVIKTSQLMLYREIIAVCSQIHTKHINTLCGLNVQLLGAFAKSRKPTISFVMAVHLSVRPSALNNSPRTGRIFIKFDVCVHSENLSSEFKFHQNLTWITGTVHEDLCTFLVPRSFLLILRNV